MSQLNKVPSRWMKCPRKGKIIGGEFHAFQSIRQTCETMFIFPDLFIPMKTPLDDKFADQISPADLFTPEMFLDMYGSQIGLWINLAFTDRFYDRQVIEDRGIKYVKLACRGHGETPSEEQTKCFIRICSEFTANNPGKLIAVHCTHGFNRTGFLITAYLLEEVGWELAAAIRAFCISRPPGIYKQDYLQELYRRYASDDPCPPAPELPDWCFEEEEEPDDLNGGSSGGDRRRSEFTKRDPVFMPGVSGATPIMDESVLSRVRRKVQRMVGWEKIGFPGAQPVSMTRDNIKLLAQKKYMVSWKADGTRYMLLIEDKDNMFFVDRDNSVFQIHGITFPHPGKQGEFLRDTLCDGEMVIDEDPSTPHVKTPRFLIYDIIVLNGKEGKEKIGNFDFATRFRVIEEQICTPRSKAIYEGSLNRSSEPFGIRRKSFYPLGQTKAVMNMKTGHEHDGLIFQPVPDPYTGGQCDQILKWKPPELNSIDFKCQVRKVQQAGCLPETYAELYVGGMPNPFTRVKLNKTKLIEFKEYDGKIVECTLDKNEWKVLRVRTDKSHPNSYNTAKAVLNSIQFPVDMKAVIDVVEQIGVGQFAQEKRKGMMPAPPLPAKHHKT